MLVQVTWWSGGVGVVSLRVCGKTSGRFQSEQSIQRMLSLSYTTARQIQELIMTTFYHLGCCCVRIRHSIWGLCPPYFHCKVVTIKTLSCWLWAEFEMYKGKLFELQPVDNFYPWVHTNVFKARSTLSTVRILILNPGKKRNYTVDCQIFVSSCASELGNCVCGVGEGPWPKVPALYYILFKARLANWLVFVICCCMPHQNRMLLTRLGQHLARTSLLLVQWGSCVQGWALQPHSATVHKLKPTKVCGQAPYHMMISWINARKVETYWSRLDCVIIILTKTGLFVKFIGKVLFSYARLQVLQNFFIAVCFEAFHTVWWTGQKGV